MGQSHLNIIKEFFPQVTVTAICDPNGPMLAKAPELAPGVAAFENPEALIASTSMLSSSYRRYGVCEFNEKCLKAGKHVFSEKPVMTTRDGCLKMVELANKYPDLAIVINHELRYSNFYGKVKSLITDGAVGRPQFAWCKCFRPPFLPKVGNWIQ